MTEIDCPSDCGYLASAREHPAAVVRRQQERDVTVLLPTVQHLTERQSQLFFVFLSAIARHKTDGLARLRDDDVAEAAAALAATLETAARGVIYEHATQSVVAQRLMTDLKEVLAELRERRVQVADGEAAIVLRAVEKGAREARNTAEGGDLAYMTLMTRLLHRNARERGPADATPAAPRSPLILP